MSFFLLLRPFGWPSSRFRRGALVDIALGVRLFLPTGWVAGSNRFMQLSVAASFFSQRFFDSVYNVANVCYLLPKKGSLIWVR